MMRITGYESIALIRKEMGKRIQQTRIARNITQKEFARRCGISVHTLSNMENGNDVSMANFCLVLKELGCLSNMDCLIPDPVSQPLVMVREAATRYRTGTPRKNAAKENVVQKNTAQTEHVPDMMKETGKRPAEKINYSHNSSWKWGDES